MTKKKGFLRERAEKLEETKGFEEKVSNPHWMQGVKAIE